MQRSKFSAPLKLWDLSKPACHAFIKIYPVKCRPSTFSWRQLIPDRTGNAGIQKMAAIQGSKVSAQNKVTAGAKLWGKSALEPGMEQLNYKENA